METTQRRGDSQREEKKAATHVGHTPTHSHTLIFMTSFCEMVLSKVVASKQTLLPKRGTGEPCTKPTRMLDRIVAGCRMHIYTGFYVYGQIRRKETDEDKLQLSKLLGTWQ